MADSISTVRRRRGTVRGRLTRIERDISSLEEKETLTPGDLVSFIGEGNGEDLSVVEM